MERAEDIDGLIARMEAMLAELQQQRDRNRHFLGTYLRTTRAVRDELAAGGFLDRDWVERWDVAFADLYLDALDLHQAGRRPPEPWAIAFAAARDDQLPPLRHVLLGMNAHINFDLPQALLAVITDQELDDPELTARRAADHRHIDEVLVARVEAEDTELASLGRSRSDRLLAPLNRLSTKRFLKESRAKVWANTRLLSHARRAGPAAYQASLAELERLAAARVADLVAPGQVVLKLALKGFGVRLPEPAG